MGNFEKLVVLTVLFLSAIVLAVTLSDNAEVADDPMNVARERLEGEGAGILPAVDPDDPGPPTLWLGREGEEDAGAAGETARAGAFGTPATRGPLLDSSLRPTGEGRAAGSEGGDDGSNGNRASRDGILVASGLRESSLLGTNIRLYDVQTEISWEALSRHLYGSDAYVGLLRSFNEEMELPEVGSEILVPTEDYTREGALRAELEPSTAQGARSGGASGASGAPALDGARYTVREGDNLSKISKRFFGTPHRWKEIYDANAAVLDSPDWVKPGMEIVIPGADSGVNSERDRGVR